MFGSKRFGKDLEAICKIDKADQELGSRMMYEAVERYAKNNFVTGCLIAMVGSTAGIISAEYVKRRKEKKQYKELKDTDK